MKNYLKIFIPYIISLLFIDSPKYSFVISWLGSFYIFYVTWFQNGKNLSDGLDIAKRIMRPIFVVQAIFVGYMSITSIFYFYDLISLETSINKHELLLTAKSQRLSLFCHIALVLGMVSQIKQRNIINKIYSGNFYLRLSIISFILLLIFSFIPGLSQFALHFNLIFSTATLYIFYCGLRDNILSQKLIGLSGFVLNILTASLSGMKEPIIMNVIVLSLLIYPLYKRTVVILAIPTLVVLFYFLPTYANFMRSQAWSDNLSGEAARELALDELLKEENSEQIAQTNWDFLTLRLSEIGMINKYIDFVPKRHEYYHFEIVQNSLASLIPRFLWPNKPITEVVSMERVYEAGITDESSPVSAKTRPYVDGYLSFGLMGAFLVMFLYGMFAQWACNKAEEYFQSYELGCIIIFNSCLRILWRGSNLEFILNSMLYGFLTIWLIYQVFKKLNISSKQ